MFMKNIMMIFRSSVAVHGSQRATSGKLSAMLHEQPEAHQQILCKRSLGTGPSGWYYLYMKIGVILSCL